MASIRRLSQAIEIARSQKDYEVVDILASRLREEIRKERQSESGFLENVGTGLAAGAVGVAEVSALGAAALLEEEEELKARDKIQSIADSIRPEGGDPDSLTYGVSSALGSIAGMAAVPIAAAYAGAPVAVGTGIAALTGVAASRGTASERARAANATEEQRNTAINSILVNATGALEALPMGRVFKSIDVPILSSLINKIGPKAAEGISGRVRNAAITGGLEGAQEVAAEVAQNLTEQEYNALAETFGGAAESFGYGAAAGAILDLFLGRRARGAADEEVTDTEVVESTGIAGLLPAPSDDLVVERGELGTVVQQDAARREREAKAEEDERILGDMPSAEVRRPTDQRDLFPEELEQSEREATGTPDEMSDADILAVMAESEAETERVERLEGEDQITEQPNMVDEAAYEAYQDRQIAERDAADDLELERMQREEDAKAEAEAEAARETRGATEQEYSELFGDTLDDADADAKDAATAIENQKALKELESNIPEAKPKVRDKQLNLPNIQSKTNFKGGGRETGDEKLLGDLPAKYVAPKKNANAATLAAKLTGKSLAPTKDTAPPVRTINPNTNKFRFNRSDKFIARHAALNQDTTKLATLVDANFPRQVRKDLTEGAKETQAQARQVQKYLSQFDTPADALMNAVSESGDPKSKKYRTYDESAEVQPSGTLPIGKDPLAENLQGTGGANAQAVLSWAKDNLSVETNAQLDIKLEEAKERAETAEAKVTELSSKEAETKKVGDRKKESDAKRDAEIEDSSEGRIRVVPDRKKLDPAKATREIDPAKAIGETGADSSLSPAQRDKVNYDKAQGELNKSQFEGLTPEQLSAKIAEDTAKFIVGGGNIDVLNLELDPKEVSALVSDVPAGVKGLLKKGDLKGALESVSKNAKSKRTKQIARVLAKNLGAMKVELRGNLESISDKIVVSAFDQDTSTVLLDPSVPLTVHALLHEATHGGVFNTLKNKSHPMTKQLDKLYKDVKPYLDTAYGAKNLNEFVAEVFSNPVFQHKLASMNPKGEDISALERFYRAVTNYVRRLIGMDTKPVGSALDSADAAIIAMLAPDANTIDSTAMDGMSTKDGVKEVLNNMTDIQKRLSQGSKKSYIESATDFLNNARIEDAAKEVWLKLTGSQALGDIARNNGYGQLGLKLDTLFGDQRGAIQRSDDKINKVLESYDAWAKKDVAQKELLNNIIYDQEYGATIYQVDPTLTRAVAKKKYGNRTAEDSRNLFEVWEANQEQWTKLKEGGRGGPEQFTALRNTYKRMHEDLVAVINREIDEIGDGKSNASKSKLKKQMNERLISSNTMDVYFPLVRQGNYKLSYTTRLANEDGTFRKEPVFLMFETEGARDSAERDAKQDSMTVENSIEVYDGDVTPSSYRSPPAGSFVADILDVVSSGGKDTTGKMQEQIMRLFIETLPETAFAKSLQRRKNTLGYIQDARLGMQVKGFDLGAQVQKMRYGGEIRAVEKAIDGVYNEGAPEGVSKKTFRKLKEELDLRAKFARQGANNKGAEQYYQRANQTAFIYTIGFNASSALVNLSQIPLVVVPYLTGKFNPTDVTVSLGRATKFVGASKISIDEYYDIKEVSTTDKDGLVSRKDVYTLKAEQEKKIRDTSATKVEADAKVKHFKRMIPLVQRAKNGGQINHSMVTDHLQVSDAGRKKNKNFAIRFLDGTSALSAVMFNTAERFNRQVTLTMSYDLTLNKLDAMHADKGNKRFYSAVKAAHIAVPTSSEARMQLAVDEAVYFSQETNGGSVLETAAGYSQQGIGRVALMYKSYGLQMYYTMIKSTKLAANNMFAKSAEGKELRNMALKQVMGIHLSALFFAGVQGLPLYGAVAMVADLLIFDDEEDDARTVTRKSLREGWYKGAITALTGVDIASRVSLNNLLLQENRFNKDPSLEESLGFYLGGPALSTGTRLKRAYDDFTSDQYGSFERGMESAMPAGLTNAWRSTFGRYAREGGIQSRRKNPIYDDMTVGDFAAQALGFPPAEYTYRQEISARNKGVEKAIIGKRSMLTKKFYIAQKMGDHEVMNQVLRDIVEHNRRHPTVTLSSTQLWKSIKSHRKTSATMHNGVTVNPLMRHAIMVSNSQYNKGY
tara:strand:- start:2521 stop:8787 length:6267 start_codon:yes stop_codon:yes gene_type:complete